MFRYLGVRNWKRIATMDSTKCGDMLKRPGLQIQTMMMKKDSNMCEKLYVLKLLFYAGKENIDHNFQE